MSPEDVHVLFEAAHTYEQLGMRDQALEWLKKAIQKGYSLKEIEWSPFLGRLRTDARYQELVRLK
jgi:serine/threonine-protein kinase